MDKLAERIYNPNNEDLAVFKKTHEEWGGYSNMAAGFPIIVNNTIIRSSEALYQALKFTGHPEIQRKIISEKSPMTAKMVSKPYKSLIREDFDIIKIKLMKWSVRAKLLSNYDKFKALLLDSNNKIIVEESRRDSFWGAKRQPDGTLVGVNVLGRILMELRYELQIGKDLEVLGRLDIPHFDFLGNPINPIYRINLSEETQSKNIQSDFFY
ncbi:MULTISPECIES: NADAR family protein [unclassified Acinetobacter]|nr:MULTISPECIES: NADAR family protein [unclassified Acinetobacter]NHB66722.1 NADAR family protein [Acinetobacter sp. GFQ9D191M]NHC00957.1 NADAR family protein [Acinetobacter sp. GFQ9D192M]